MLRSHKFHVTSLQCRFLFAESLLAAGSLSALARHAPSPVDGSTHTSPSPGLGSHGTSSRQASTDVKHALSRSTSSRSLSRESRKDPKVPEPRSKSETRRDRGPEQTTTLDLSRDRPCDLRVNTDSKKRHSVTEILRTPEKREKRCESVPLQLRSPEPAGSRSRPQRASLQLDGPPLDVSRADDGTESHRVEGREFTSPPPSSRAEGSSGKGNSDSNRMVTSPNRGSGVTLYSKRKPNTEGKSGKKYYLFAIITHIKTHLLSNVVLFRFAVISTKCMKILTRV